MNARDLLRVVAAVLLILCGLDARSGDKKAYSNDDLHRISATVESIDRHSRRVVLASPDGQRGSFVAGPQVHNLDRVNPGDHVVLSYRLGITAHIKPSDT